MPSTAAPAVVSSSGPEGSGTRIEISNGNIDAGGGEFSWTSHSSTGGVGRRDGPNRVDAGSVESSVTPVAAPSLLEASSTTPSTEAVAPTEDNSAPPSVDPKPGTEPPEAPDGSPDPEAAADLPVARAELGDIIDANAASTGAEGAPAEGEEKPELPVAPSTTKPEEFHVPRDAKRGYEKELKSLIKAKRDELGRNLTESEAQELREQALKAHWQKEAARVKTADVEIEEIRKDPKFKGLNEAVARERAADLKPGDMDDPDEVEIEALAKYLEAKAIAKDKLPFYQRWKKKLGFGKMIAEILLAVGLSTGEQAGTQSVKSLQPGR